MSGEYCVEIRDQRDLERHALVYNEMLTMTQAFRAAHKCEVCGGKKTHAKRHGEQVVVTCAGCVGKKPTAERREINRVHAEMRAALVETEKRCTP